MIGERAESGWREGRGREGVGEREVGRWGGVESSGLVFGENVGGGWSHRGVVRGGAGTAVRAVVGEWAPRAGWAPPGGRGEAGDGAGCDGL